MRKSVTTALIQGAWKWLCPPCWPSTPTPLPHMFFNEIKVGSIWHKPSHDLAHSLPFYFIPQISKFNTPKTRHRLVVRSANFHNRVAMSSTADAEEKQWRKVDLFQGDKPCPLPWIHNSQFPESPAAHLGRLMYYYFRISIWVPALSLSFDGGSYCQTSWEPQC